MKPLDEVIKALTICKNPDINRNCKDCPMPDTQECMGVLMTDALHYLKDFKRISARLEKIALGNITETLEKLDNPALTWDELKQMEGKPVWVEIFYPVMEDEIGATEDEGKWEGYWALRTHRKHEFLIVEKQREPLYEEDYGKSWKAYRKERE